MSARQNQGVLLTKSGMLTCLFLAAVVVGTLSCGSSGPGPDSPGSGLGFAGTLEPVGKCLFFQDKQPFIEQEYPYTFTFPAGTIKAAPGGRIISKPASTAQMVNSSGSKGVWKPNKYGTTVASIVFDSSEKVKVGNQWFTAGDIKQITISSDNCDINFWGVCYW